MPVRGIIKFYSILLLAGIAAVLLKSQNPDYVTHRCAGVAGSPARTPYIVLVGQNSQETCAAIGPGLQITTVNGHAQLDVKPVPIVPPGTGIVWVFEQKACP